VYPLGGSTGFKLELHTIDQLRRDDRSADVEEEFLGGDSPTPVVEDDRPSIATRMRVILALSVLSWLAVAVIAIGIMALLRAI